MRRRLSLSSVRMRLALWNVGVLAFVLVCLGIVFSVTMRANIAASIDQRLGQKAYHARHFFDNPALYVRLSHPTSQDNAVGPTGEMRPRWFNSVGRPFIATDVPWDTAGLKRAALGEEVYATISTSDGDTRVFTLPIRQGTRIIGLVQVGNSLTHVYEERARMTRTLLYLIPVVLLVAGLGGAFLTGHALRPVRQIASAAGRIEAEDLSQRLPVLGDDEFADLAETINGMLARLQASFERQEQAFAQQQRFAADASHELRTPLTIIKANTSLSLSERRTEYEYEKTLRAVDAAADRMTRIVQDLLLLARADADQLAYTLTPTPLADVLNAAAASLPETEGAPIHLNLPAKPLLTQGHADSLVRLFSNLMENAARHTPADGQIQVTAEEIAGQCIIEVADTGSGIAPEHLPHVTERFYRVEAARTRAHGGTGLGLSICRSIVDAHGGTLEIESAVGSGTTVRITLPGTEDYTQTAEFNALLTAQK